MPKYDYSELLVKYSLPVIAITLYKVCYLFVRKYDNIILFTKLRQELIDASVTALVQSVYQSFVLILCEGMGATAVTAPPKIQGSLSRQSYSIRMERDNKNSE